MPVHLTSPTELHAAFTASALQVPAPSGPEPPSPGGVAGGERFRSMAWLRATVARFSSGPDHARRRAHATTALAAIDPAALRTRAHQLAATTLAAAGTSLDVLPDLARRVPLAALAAALLPASAAADVPAVVAAALTAAPGYLVPSPRVDEIDSAVAELVRLLGTDDGEATANRIALLLQAADATAGLIGNAIPHALNTSAPTEAVLAEVLRHDPPVRLARRVAVRDTTLAGSVVPAGTPVMLHLAEANRAAGRLWTFGDGEHRCPGDRHALALAAGVLDAVRCGERRWRTGKVVRDPDAHPSTPSYLEIVETEGAER